MLDLVFEFSDIWRVRLSAADPAKVTPPKVDLKPDELPCKAKARLYTPKILDFMRKQIKFLEKWVIFAGTRIAGGTRQF